MRIDNFEVYCEKLNKILDELDSFCASIEVKIYLHEKQKKKILKLMLLSKK